MSDFISLKSAARYRISFLSFVVLTLFMCLVIIMGFRFLEESSPRNSITISFIDVGQGDATLIQQQESVFDGNQVLIDAGANRSVLAGIGSIIPFFDRQIEYILATHPDTDHIGGYADVFKRYQIDTIIDNGDFADSPAYQAYVAGAKSAEQYFIDDSVSKIAVSPQLSITFIPVPDIFSDRNDNSIITRVDYGSFSTLLTGDASIKVEEYLIDNYKDLLDVDVLKLGHHGSRTSTSLDFLLVTSPDEVIISAPLDSRYGHPHDEVLSTIQQYGRARVWYTGSEGTITFTPEFSGNYDVKKTR